MPRFYFLCIFFLYFPLAPGGGKKRGSPASDPSVYRAIHYCILPSILVSVSQCVESLDALLCSINSASVHVLRNTQSIQSAHVCRNLDCTYVLVYCILSVSRDRQSILNSLRQVVFGGLQGMQGKLWASRDSYSHQSLQLAAEHV